MINIYGKYCDSVIGGIVVMGDTTYADAIKRILPLSGRLDSQRKILDTKFYTRLEKDILKGCMMPPITLAFICNQTTIEKLSGGNSDQIKKFIESEFANGYVLDGLQRLNTLQRASTKADFPNNQHILLNIIIAQNEDRLLYRMITLNNGQKPMSPRHQIEILTQELFDFTAYPNLIVQTEKERANYPQKDAYSQSDFSKAYTAFITGAIHTENSKLIEEKMDQILVSKILDSDISGSLEFKDVLALLNKLNVSSSLKRWFRISNNLIAFSAAIKKSYGAFSDMQLEDIENAIANFEEAFKSFNPSKINLGKIRRQLVYFFISHISDLKDYSSSELMERFMEETAQ